MNLSYADCLELREHGFPQIGDGFALIVDNPEVFEDKEDATMTVIPWCKYVYQPTEKYGPTMYCPTLEELIESVALPWAYFSLERHSNDWHAGFISGHFKEQLGLLSFRSGSTPSQAVKNLYCALNPKK